MLTVLKTARNTLLFSINFCSKKSCFFRNICRSKSRRAS